MHILKTKLNRPAIDSRWIVRPRLLSALDDAFSRKPTLITAPAGYGKTTLAAQWLDHIPHPSAWLSLDEHDSDPDRFLEAFARRFVGSDRIVLEYLMDEVGSAQADEIQHFLGSAATFINQQQWRLRQ